MNTYADQVAELTDEELRKHAILAMHHCKCADCFCCAALDEQRARAGKQREFEKLQNDLSLSDTYIKYSGQWAVLFSKHRPITKLAMVTINARAVLKLMAWCVKNHYRCSSIVNGEIVP